MWQDEAAFSMVKEKKGGSSFPKLNSDIVDLSLWDFFHHTYTIRPSNRKWLLRLPLYQVTQGELVLSSSLIVQRSTGGEKIGRQSETATPPERWVTLDPELINDLVNWLRCAQRNHLSRAHAANSYTLPICHMVRSNNVKLLLCVICSVHERYLCTWYSEGLLRRRSEEGPG